MITITIQTTAGETILQAQEPVLLSTLLSDHQMPLAMPCGGRRKCKKCRIRAWGDLSPFAPEESDLFTAQELADGYRLACTTYAQGDVTVALAEVAETHVLTAGDLPPIPFGPMGKTHGVAVDIGTTTVAAYLYDLKTGTQLATASMLNPQAPFGADVISRMQKSAEGQSQQLADAIRGGLANLVAQLCQKASIANTDIDSMVLTGNTAMEFLLTKEDPNCIIVMPFIPSRYFGEWVSPKSLDLDLPCCEAVYITHCISAYVGGDITMSSMAAELHRRSGDAAPCLMVDIGTNGEMVLYAKDKWYCCSTAAGPTFEGADIHMGMTAKEGAVSKIQLVDGEIVSSVIGGGAGTGICGTGIIDAVAILLKLGVVDMTGRLNETGHGYESCICTVDDKPAFQLPGTQVTVTQGDVRNVQLAKSAICAGMMTLLHHAELDGQAVELKIAGGFGSFIDVESAEKIGLIPKGFAATSKAIGNAAGAGACMVLLSQETKEQSEAFAKTAQTVDLSMDPYFIQNYTMNMMFL